MKFTQLAVALFLVLTPFFTAESQVTNSLPGRSLVKFVPDYGRPRMYALNRAVVTNSGTLLALNSTNGSIISEITVGINPTDMVLTSPGDALYVINAGSRTISKVDLSTFSVVAEKTISTPNTYNVNNPLYLAAGRSNLVYFTDGGWAPNITTFDYAGGTNVAVYDDGNGTGGLIVTRNGNTLYRWRQYGWGAGNVNSWVTRYDTVTNNLTPFEDSFVSWRRDPIDTPLFLDVGEQWVFNKEQKFAATNVSVLLTSFADNIYAISLDGSLAFGPTEVYNAQTGILLTNLSFSTTVQALSGDQERLFRYQSSPSTIYVYDMAAIAPVSGPTPVPTPPDGAVVGLAPTNLVWTGSPIALSYDVYFGTNRNQVTTATPGSGPYLGRVTTTSEPVPGTLTPGLTYYWRVDVVGFSTTNAGPTWSFTVATLAVVPSQLSVGAIGGFNPTPMTLSLTSAVARAWSASVAGANWVSVSPSSGTSPSTVTVSFNTAGLAPGLYTNQINITAAAQVIGVPVYLRVDALNIVKMATDYQRPYIYALQAPVLSGQSGQVLFINTTNGNIDKTLPIGINPVDLTVHNGEGRLYIASWTENATYVVDLTTQTLLPPLQLGTDVYKINAGQPGQLMIEGEDQWVYVSLINTTNGGTIVSGLVREGDGEFDPTGRYYYHCNNNISGAGINKFDMGSNTFNAVAGAGGNYYYGSRNVILCADGTRVFWTGEAYDSNLNPLGNLGEEIYAATAHGDLAFGNQHVFNVNNGQNIYTLPFSTSIISVSGDQTKVFLYNSATSQLVTIPMSSIATVPGPGLNPTPPDRAVVNPPLGQVSWTTSPFALSYQVFMGTNRAAVAAADTNSALYLGNTTATSFILPSPLTLPGSNYWRVDSVGFSSVTTGAVWSFAVAGLSIAPQQLSLKGVAGLPILPQTLSLTAAVPTSWTLSVAQGWITPSAYSGTTPASLTLNFNTSGMTAGYYTNQLSFTANGVTLQFPVVLQLFTLSASKIAEDPNRNYIYVLHPGSGSFDDAFLLFLNTDTGVVEKVIPIGNNPTDLSVNSHEDRLYVSNWQHNQTRVVDLVSRTEILPPLALGTDVYKINAGAAGQIMIEGEDQWVNVSLINTTNGGTIVSGVVREGDGEFDPTGRYYYHCNNNISGAGINKFDMGSNTFNAVAGAGGNYYYGSRNVILSADGSRVFWTGEAYDSNLNPLGNLGDEIYACSTNGSIAFGNSRAYETATRQLIYNLPVTSSVMAVDRMNQRLWYFNSGTAQIESVPISVISSPSITQQPAASTVVNIGGNVNLTVTAMGLSPLAYQWTLAGTNVPGATNYFLAMNGIQPSQAGNYQVLVSNPFGVVTSAVANVTVIVPPAITLQPQGTNVLAGRPFSLSVLASGTAPLSYTWTFENTTVSGATSSSLVISNAQPANEGVYQVIVANSAGSITSSLTMVRVLPSAPVIVSYPASVTVGASSNASFNVSAMGTQPLFYQWFLNNSPLPGATGTQYSLVNAQSGNGGSYRVTVSNAVGTASASATLTVLPVAPYFVTQPVSATLPGSTNLTLTALAHGTEPLAYQWRRSGTNLAGASLTALVFTNLSIGDSGAYDVLATSSAGIRTSLVANVVITAAPPVFVQQPASVSVLSGTSATFNSLATGSLPLAYQWFFQTNALPNQTNRQLTLNPVSLSLAGPYYVIATNIFGQATSTVATLTVTTAPPVFVQQPASVSALAGSNTTLNSLANGAAPLYYQWFFQGGALANQTNRQLTINPVTAASAGPYFVVASNVFGSVSSVVATVTVNFAPGFSQALSNLVVDAGRTVTLSVAATGTGPLTYTWTYNGQRIAGTTSSLVLSNIQVSQAGYYTVNAGSQYGSASSTARISVFGPSGWALAWGDNSGGQTNVPSGLDDTVALAGGDFHSLALRHDGTLLAWGYNGDGQCSVPTNNLRFVAIAAGAGHNLAINETGTVSAWGRNTSGQCNVPAAATSVLSVAAGDGHSLALLSSGTIVGWGDNTYSQASGGSGLTGVRSIAAGRNHSLALRTNGTVAGWGYNAYGQASPPLSITNAVAVAAGYLHSAALLSNGTVVVWGDNSYGQLNVPLGLSNALAIAAGDFNTLALRADGTIIGWGNDSYGQNDIAGGVSNAVAVAAGNYHGEALVPVVPFIQSSLTAAGLVLQWNGVGVLQSAPAAPGPYTDMPWVTGRSYTNTDFSAPTKYFRLRR